MSDSGHTSPDTLADLHEGLLHERAETAAREHLATCAQCRADLAALAALPATLAAAGEIGPVPDDVAGRLDAALDAASRAPADGPAATTVVPLASAGARTSPRGLRLLQAAAVLVVVLGLGGLAVSALRDSGHGSAADSSAGSAAGPVAGTPELAYPVTASGRSWTATTLTAAVPRLLAGTLARPVAHGPLPDGTRKAADATPSPAATGPAPQGSATDPSFSVLQDNPGGRLVEGTPLASCVASLVGGPATPLAVDVATYQGSPAVVILLPGLTGADRVDIWVVRPDCSTGTLYYGSVPRP